MFKYSFGSGIISRIKSELAAAFDMVDMGPLAFYVGLKVTRDRENRTIKLSQPGYIEKLLDRHGMLKAKTTKVPMRETVLLPSDKSVSDLDKAKYSAKVRNNVLRLNLSDARSQSFKARL